MKFLFRGPEGMAWALTHPFTLRASGHAFGFLGLGNPIWGWRQFEQDWRHLLLRTLRLCRVWPRIGAHPFPEPLARISRKLPSRHFE